MLSKRGPNKVQNPYTFIDMYQMYIKEVDKGSPYDITYNEYVEVCSLFYKKVIDYLLFNNGTWIFPYGLGALHIIKKKLKVTKDNLPIDWKLTREYGKRIYHLNEHTSGFLYRFYWDKRNSKQTNRFLYIFDPSRSNKRRLAKLIKSGKCDYFELF